MALPVGFEPTTKFNLVIQIFLAQNLSKNPKRVQ